MIHFSLFPFFCAPFPVSLCVCGFLVVVVFCRGRIVVLLLFCVVFGFVCYIFYLGLSCCLVYVCFVFCLGPLGGGGGGWGSLQQINKYSSLNSAAPFAMLRFPQNQIANNFIFTPPAMTAEPKAPLSHCGPDPE